MKTEKIDKKAPKTKNTPTPEYNRSAFIHSKFSNLISSGSVYSLRFTPKKKKNIRQSQ